MARHTPAKTTFAERAYQILRDRLIMLAIPPGSPIDDGRLAAELGFGRTPVREALKRLEAERLVISYPRRGTFATDVHISDLRHVSEVRMQLEPMGVAIAARRATADDHDQLRALHRELDTVGPAAAATDPTALMTVDLRVHRAVYAAVHNPYLEDTLQWYDNLATRIWCLFLDRLPDLAGHVDEHRPLLQAVIAGDAEAAARMSAEHVAHFETAIRAIA